MLVNENTRRNLEQEIAGFRAHAAAGERAMQARLPFARSHLEASGLRASPSGRLYLRALPCVHTLSLAAWRWRYMRPAIPPHRPV